MSMISQSLLDNDESVIEKQKPHDSTPKRNKLGRNKSDPSLSPSKKDLIDEFPDLENEPRLKSIVLQT